MSLALHIKGKDCDHVVNPQHAVIMVEGKEFTVKGIADQVSFESFNDLIWYSAYNHL